MESVADRVGGKGVEKKKGGEQKIEKVDRSRSKVVIKPRHHPPEAKARLKDTKMGPSAVVRTEENICGTMQSVYFDETENYHLSAHPLLERSTEQRPYV